MKNLYKLSILLIALTFNVSLVLAQTATAPAVGDGTSENPYQIATLDNLYWLSQTTTAWVTGKYFIQTADIDASTTSGWDGGGWTPIGNDPSIFTGSYDGQGHTIDGLFINRPGTNDVGLFGMTSSTAIINNLGVTNVNITGYQNVGGLVGSNYNSSEISNCYTTGSVNGVNTIVGGLVGYNYTATINKCYSGCSVNGSSQVGGLVGYNRYLSINNCYSTGSVSGNFDIGGLVGLNKSGAVVSNCYSKGLVSGTSTPLGGLVGNNQSSVNNSFWDIETSGQATSAGGTGKTTAEMKTQSTFTGATWDFTEGTGIWAMSSTITFGGYPTLQWTNSYATAPSSNEIATLSNLVWVAESSTRWAASYTQTADIDASVTSGWDGGAGWTPIGNAVTKFSGNYHGQGYIINHLSFNRPSSQYHGFFGYTLGATIQNISLQNISMTGGTGWGGDTFEGGLIGYADGTTISGCYSTGTISGHQTVGGLIGGAYSSGSLITSCYSTATVSADGSAAGGFIGRNMNGSTISKCYSSGNVSAPSTVGGFAGYNLTITSTPVISDCYCKSTSVSGTSYTGGFISYNSGSITSCYTTATLTGSQKLYGFASYATPATTNCFWDVETDGISGNVSGATNLGSIGKTTLEMKTQSTFTGAGWDVAIWNIGDGINDGYPYLDWQNPSGTPLPVELTSFSAAVNGSSVVLNWQTATEVNNYGFEIEKAVSSGQSAVGDGSLSWSKCGFVQGNGNSNSPKEYTFTDEKISNGKYSYRLKQIDNDGKYEYSKEIEIDVDKIPTVFALAQNYPNPFNPATVISFQLPVDSKVQLKIYDVVGSEVATLVNEERPAGIYTVEFNAANFTSGVYFYRMQAGNFVETKKLLLIK